MAAILVWRDGPTEFVATQWLFDYGHGIAKRGLVGTVLRRLGGDATIHLPAAATTLYLATTAVLSVTMANLAVGRTRISRSRLVLAVAVAVSVSGFPALAGSFGRFDTPVAGLATVAALAVASEEWWSPFLAGVLLVAAVAIHEAALLLVAPWLASYAYSRAEQSDSWRHPAVPAMVILAMVTATTVAIAVQSPGLTPAELTARLFPGGASPIQEFAIGIHYRSLADNLVLTWQWAQRYGLLIVPDSLSIVPVVGVSVLVLRAAGLRWPMLSHGHRAMFVASFSPLLLCLLAYDWGRWWSFTGSLIGITTLVVLADREIDPPTSRILVMALVLSLAVTAFFGGTRSHALGLL